MGRGWSSLPLSEAHIAELKGSGISYAAAKARGYATVEWSDRPNLMTLGYSERQLGRAAFPALLIPLYAPRMVTATHSQLKPARPRSKGAGRAGKGPKYETPVGCGNRLDAHPSIQDALGDPRRRKWIVEGAKKADALVALGEVAISITGVWNWRGKNSRGGKVALGDFETIAWDGCDVYVCFDSDAASNSMVSTAMRRLVDLTRSRGAEALYVVVPGDPADKVGADDFLSAGGTVDDLIAAAVDWLPTEKTTTKAAVAIVMPTFTSMAQGRIAYVAPWKTMLRYDDEDGIWKRDHPGPGSKPGHGMHACSVAFEAVRACIDDGSLPHREMWWSTRLAKDLIDALVNSGGDFVINTGEIDANPLLLNCTNGVVDLRTGDLLPHDSAYLMMKSTHVRYVGADHTTADVSTLLEIIDDDERAWLQRYLGMGTIGQVGDEVLLVAIGIGANGKTTLMEAIGMALGDYAQAVPSRLLTMQGGREHLTLEADLHGLRIAWASETDSGSVLDMERVKALTGGDTLKVRRLYENLWELRPSHTLLMLTNNEPIVDRSDKGTWRRLRMLRFPYSYIEPPCSMTYERPADKGLRLRLINDRHNREALLSWLVDGAGFYLSHGLGHVPESMDRATTEWRVVGDPVGTFFEEHMKAAPTCWLKAADVVDAYTKWQIDRGDIRDETGAIDPRTLRSQLSQVTQERGGVPISSTKIGGSSRWSGIAWL